MKTHTHLLTGFAVGSSVGSFDGSVPGFILATAAGGAGGLLPDVFTFMQTMADDRAKRPRFSTEQEGSLWFFLKEIGHSPLLWLLGFGLALLPTNPSLRLPLMAATLGALSHWIADAFTHGGDEFRDTDQSLLWPLYYALPSYHSTAHIPKLGNLMARAGLGWEYRYDYKRLGTDVLKRTKSFERFVQAAAAAIWLILVVRFLTA